MLHGSCGNRPGIHGGTKAREMLDELTTRENLMPLNRQPSARKLSLTFLLAAAFAVALIVTPTARAAEKSSFKVAWSIYVGWMPWDLSLIHISEPTRLLSISYAVF